MPTPENISRPAHVTEMGFYSALAAAISSMRHENASPQGWCDLIRGLVNNGLVKQDEVEWCGLEDWLALQNARVSKSDVLGFLDRHGVQIKEVQLMEGFNDWFVRDGASHDLAQDNLGDSADEAQILQNDEVNGGVQYIDQTLPGGTNYREILLYLPFDESAAGPVAKREQFSVFRGEQILSQGTWPPIQRTQDQLAANPDLRMTRQWVVDQNDARRKGLYQSSHWEQLNVLAHIRVNDRVGANRKRILFVEEIQSDWAQEGRKSGFVRNQAMKKGVIEQQDNSSWLVRWEDGSFSGGYSHAAAMETARKGRPFAGVMVAPFVQKTDGWLNLALKRLLVIATEGGYDQIAFINGEQSTDRYSLNEGVSSVSIGTSADEVYNLVFDFDNGLRQSRPSLSAQEVAKFVGKDFSARLIANAKMWRQANQRIHDELSQGKDEDSQANLIGLIEALDAIQIKFENPGIKIGGEGMKAFYDTIVPNALKTLLKKLRINALTHWSKIDIPSDVERLTAFPEGSDWIVTDANDGRIEHGRFASQQEAVKFMRNAGLKQMTLDVDDSLRDRVRAGLPLFSRRKSSVSSEVKGASKDVPEPKPAATDNANGEWDATDEQFADEFTKDTNGE